MTKNQIQINKAIKWELSKIKAIQDIKPHEEAILLDMVLGHYGSIHRDFIYPRELYNLEEEEIEFLKGLHFRLGDYPFTLYELDTESTFYVNGVKMVDIVFEQTDLHPSGLLLVVKEALGRFACASKYLPKNDLPPMKIIEWKLGLLLSLLIDFKWSSWEQNYRRVSRKLPITKDDWMDIRRRLFHTIQELESRVKQMYLTSTTSKTEPFLSTPKDVQLLLASSLQNGNRDDISLKEKSVVINNRSSKLISIIWRYLQVPLQRRVKKVSNEKFNEFKKNLEVIQIGLDMLGELIDNQRSTIPKHVSDYFKCNLLDPDFVGKHGLTFEDKDVFTMIVVLEEVFHGIVEFSINSFFSDLFTSIFSDSNSMTSLEEKRIWTKRHLIMRINKLSENLLSPNREDAIYCDEELAIDQRWYGIGLETFLNYSWDYRPLGKSIFRLEKLHIPNFRKDLTLVVESLKTTFCDIYQRLYVAYRQGISENVSKSILLKKKGKIIDEIFGYLHYIQLSASEEIPGFLFSPERDFELREMSKFLFGSDIFSKSRYNLSNRVQLKQFALALQSLLIHYGFQNSSSYEEGNSFWLTDEFVNII